MIPNVNEDLTGLSPVDWEIVRGKYPAVGTYELGEIVPRDEVMRSIVHRDGVGEQFDAPLEDICKKLTDDQGPAAIEVRKLAKHYIVFRNKNARLPGFGKWVSRMFKDDQQLVAVMARAAQHVRPAQHGIVISCNPVDILRGGLGRHFQTCLGPKDYEHGGYYRDGNYADVLPAVLTECPGIAVAFVPDGDHEHYKARAWVHHIKVGGKTAIQINDVYGNGMTREKLAKLIASKGYDVYDQSWGGKNYEFINNFERDIHWDAIETSACGNLIAAAEGIPNLKKQAA